MSNLTQIIDAEIVPNLDDKAVKRLDTRIRLTAGTIGENWTRLQEYVSEAKDNKLHERLGFASWTAYLADALGGMLPALKTGDRRELVEYLSDEGMSTHAIAPVLGVNQSTVARDLKSRDAFASPGSSTKLEQRRKHFNQPKPGADAVEPVTDLDSQAKVIGLDGKKYTRTRQEQPKPPAAEKDGTGIARHDAFLKNNRRKSAGQPHLILHRVIKGMATELAAAETLVPTYMEAIENEVTRADALEYLEIMGRQAKVAEKITALLSSIAEKS